MSMTYANLRKYNIVTNTSDIINHVDYDRLINLSELNIFLFGKEEIPLTSCRQLLLEKKIITMEGNKPYLILSKINEYFDSIGELENHMDDYMLINYYNIIDKKLSQFDSFLFLFWTIFKKYLSKKKNPDAKTILNYIGKDYFKGKIEAHQKETNIKSISFKTIYKPFIITFGFGELDDNYYVNLSNPNYKKLYVTLFNEILRSNPDNYVIHNLARVTTNRSFAEMIFHSHKDKSKFNISLDLLDTIIKFKSKALRNEYIEKFITNYEHGVIYKLSDKGLMINFEGLNKYFLNLEEKYLSSFQMKEMVNNMYCSITNELIHCYQTLFNMSIE